MPSPAPSPGCSLPAPARRGSGLTPPSPQGFEYQERQGQCCGFCKQVACVTNTSDSSVHLFYVSGGHRAQAEGFRA